jgi:cytochrome c553
MTRLAFSARVVTAPVAAASGPVVLAAVTAVAVIAAAASPVAVVAADRAAGAVKGDRELGQYLSSECVTCHQISGRYDGIPPIVGWPEESFVEILSEYRDKKRENQVMRSIAVKFSDEEIAALAAYFGSLKPRTD